MKKVLITGGCGFIGSSILAELAERTDLAVTVLDNYSTCPLPVITHSPYTTFVTGDIRDRQVTRDLIYESDVIVHLAAVVGTPACNANSDLALDVNINGTVNLLSHIRGQKFIFTSSADVYGKQTSRSVTESNNVCPTSTYAIHKITGEALIKAKTNKHIILRPSSAFGVSQQFREDTLLNTLITRALMNGTIEIYEPDVYVSFSHVIDTARAIIWAIDGELAYGTYNIANPAFHMTKGDAAREVAKYTGALVQYVEGKDITGRNYKVSSAKLLSSGFEFNYDHLLLGIEQIKEHLSNR